MACIRRSLACCLEDSVSAAALTPLPRRPQPRGIHSGAVAQLPADDLEARVRSLEQAVGQLRDEVTLTRTDAAAARELAAGADRDVSEVRAELRAHTQALNALRENQLEQGGAIADLRAEMRQGFTTVNAGMNLIVELLGRTLGDDTPEA